MQDDPLIYDNEILSDYNIYNRIFIVNPSLRHVVLIRNCKLRIKAN